MRWSTALLRGDGLQSIKGLATSSLSSYVSGCCSVVLCPLTNRQESTITMQTSTVVVLLCLIVAVCARPQEDPSPVDAAQESLLDTPAHDRSPRNKRGLLLLKKKLLLGALGVKAAKVAAAGAGVVGVLALKAKAKPKAVAHTSYFSHGW